MLMLNLIVAAVLVVFTFAIHFAGLVGLSALGWVTGLRVSTTAIAWVREGENFGVELRVDREATEMVGVSASLDASAAARRRVSDRGTKSLPPLSS